MKFANKRNGIRNKYSGEIKTKTKNKNSTIITTTKTTKYKQYRYNIHKLISGWKVFGCVVVFSFVNFADVDGGGVIFFHCCFRLLYMKTFDITRIFSLALFGLGECSYLSLLLYLIYGRRDNIISLANRIYISFLAGSLTAASSS